MLMTPRSRPIVFGGPSLELVDAQIGDRLDLRPPIRRGDLEALLDGRSRTGCVLITDGCFGQDMSVSSVECLRLIKAGWLLLGSSSIGALRAADCSKVGMVGVGHVFMGYRLGYFKSDADVAVRYAGNVPFEMTVSYVHADYIAKELARDHGLTQSAHRRFLQALRKVPWHERTAPSTASLFADIHGNADLAPSFIEAANDPRRHPKKLDALLAVRYLNTLYLKQALE